MKKYLALVLGVIFTLGFAVSAFAIHAEIPAETQAVVAKGATQIKLGGELRFRGSYKHGTDLKSAGTDTTILDTANDSDSKYDGRVRLRIQADVSKNTQGVIHLEAGSDTGDTYTWGSVGQDAGVYTVGNGKKGSLFILEAWILHKFNIGVPAGIKVGHMPLKLGNGIFFNHTKFGDDAILVFVDPVKELEIALLTIKLSEGKTTITDDADAYVALFAYKTKGFNVSGDYTLVDDKSNTLTTDGAVGAASAAGDLGTHITNLGLRADATFANFNVMADAEIQSGKTDYEAADVDIKHKGRAFVVGASYKASPATLRAKYGYGSGDNDSTDKDNNVFVTAVPDTKNLTYVYDYNVKGATGSKNRGIANTTFVNLGVTANLTKDLSALVDYYVLRASKVNSTAKINGASSPETHLSKKIGSEVDAKITYKLDKNLVYFVEGGYLWTGAFYDTATVQAKDAYAVRHGITLSF